MGGGVGGVGGVGWGGRHMGLEQGSGVDPVSVHA
jgi:hypothetical protein